MKNETCKLEAEAFQAVIRKHTTEVVGYRYRWNDGSVQILWINGHVKNVEFVDLCAENNSGR